MGEKFRAPSPSSPAPRSLLFYQQENTGAITGVLHTHGFSGAE